MVAITVIPGDGIGPEITAAMQKVVEAAGADMQWRTVKAGAEVYEETGTLIPDNVFSSLEETKVGIKGPMTTPIGTGFRSANVALRKRYDLYANIRPVMNLGDVPAKFTDLDLVLFRENTEDLYAGVEEQISEDEAHSIKIITRAASERIIRQAFEYARNTGRNKVAVVTKANIMKLTDGMFLECGRKIATDYPEIELQEVLVDNMAMQLVMNPHKFQVIVTENLYGDILSDLMAGLIGGLGLVPGANIGDEMAIFEAVHGTAPDIAGQNKANPTALILSACMMLDHIGQKTCADRIRAAIHETLRNPENYTADLGGNCGTTEYAAAVISNLPAS
ncbi:isocitrate dehydrogenase (NAD+) [Actinobaculum suis]|uniref:Isocitrate/homoisocitrate dehydrogenase n=1 Tax=Actinobaculum suis TaxID=1657 RepID=A0A0K9ET49_9ACTO|nr:isocitrate/isopropylmalate dehydrogenase family protein [Actinobaculum suis]KMY23060.1 isocitrate dehydrogenase [Actinobaculum suis]MDY5153939.1 isocitrate/isopropylmalate dehydrogenase family protein [Actinobaculum suis]SDE05068.1 isocitrate dehydrogenase (NAD+) [Actinobaculum suis]